MSPEHDDNPAHDPEQQPQLEHEAEHAEPVPVSPAAGQEEFDQAELEQNELEQNEFNPEQPEEYQDEELDEEGEQLTEEQYEQVEGEHPQPIEAEGEYAGQYSEAGGETQEILADGQTEYAPAEDLPVATVADAGATEEEALLQPCTNCATLLDVTDAEPFGKVHCPICGTAIRARTQLKNFTLVEVLGAGGMGAVYKALDTNLDRMVALKVVRKEFSSDAEYLAKFEREARITASVNHPNVVKVYSFGSDHGLFYIAMELVDKGSLDDLMNLQGRVAEIQALAVGIQVAQGLSAAHQKGLIHRDVKPGNILFADAQTGKIVDFGLALLAEHEAEERGEVWGTPYYVAPEKLDHQPEDFRSDMYSLGGTLFHAIAGRPPFEADTASMVALKHLKSRAVSLQAFAPDVSSATAFVINRMLHKEPDKRYQSYAELVEHLEYARAQLIDAGTGPRKPRQRVVVESASQQKVSGIITLVLILLIIAIGVGLYLYRDRLFHTGDEAATAAGGAATAASADVGDSAAKRMHDEFDTARKQISTGDFTAAMNTLQKLNDEPELIQPLQNWVTVSEGLVSLFQEKESDARDYFKVVRDRSHYSSDPSDAALVSFFSRIGTAMTARGPITPSAGGNFALDSGEAIAPLLFALKDWSLGRIEDAGGLFGIYLAATPKDPFQWVADFKPLAQKYADQEAALEKVEAAIAAADTPEKRAAALKQLQALQGAAKGVFAAQLLRMEKDLRKKSASLDPIFNQQAAEAAQHDQAAMLDAKRKYVDFCAHYRFTDAQAAIAALSVITPAANAEKDALLKKATWLSQFKACLVQNINTYGYINPLVNKVGEHVLDGTRKATNDALTVQTQFGSVPFPWDSFPPAEILAIELQFAKSMEATLPQQAADRNWLSGVFACEEGMAKDGHNLLVQASQVKEDYKNQLNLFMNAE